MTGQEYNPNHPDNIYPKHRYHKDAPDASVIVGTPSHEAEETPDEDGWFDLRRDAFEAAKAEVKGKGGRRKPSTDGE